MFIPLHAGNSSSPPIVLERYQDKAISFKYKNSDSLIFYLNKAMKQANISVRPESEIQILFLLIEANIKLGKHTNALYLCDTVKVLIENHGLTNLNASANIRIGNVYQAMGFISESLTYFFDALNDINLNDNNKNLIDLYYYIAYSYFYMSELETCRIYLDKSILLANESDLIKEKFASYLLYSSTYYDLITEQKYLNMAESILEKNPGMQYEKVGLYNNQALIHKALGDYNTSKKKYLEAINIAESNKFQQYLSNLYNNYAYLLMAELKYDSIKYYLDQALDISINIENLEMEFEIYDSYSDYFERTGNFEQALKYTDLFVKKRDEYIELQQIQRATFLSVVFETEQKEKQILEKENRIVTQRNYILIVLTVVVFLIGFMVYLRQKLSLKKTAMQIMDKNKSLEVANAVIEGQDDERKRLAMDLHDGLGAKLGAHRLILDGYFKSHKNYDEIAKSIIGIHQNVRELSHRMLPPELENLGMVESIRNLISLVNRSDKFNADFESNINSRLPEKLEKNIYFIVYELVNNAFRHSRGNNILVQLFKHENHINLSVEDNGGGFDYKDSINGMGLKNIRIRVDYLRGKINVDSNENDTYFMIEIPIYNA